MMSDSPSELTADELRELSYVLTQVSRDEIRQMYWKLNLPKGEADAAIEAALSAKDKMKELFKATLSSANKERCPNCNSHDIHWKDEYHLGWHCKLCGSSFHRPIRK